MSFPDAEWNDTPSTNLKQDIEDAVEAIAQCVPQTKIRGQRMAVEFLNLLADRAEDALKDHGENGVAGFLQAMEKGLDRIREAYGVERNLESLTSLIVSVKPGGVLSPEIAAERNHYAAGVRDGSYVMSDDGFIGRR